jgi:hypothetical protein
VINDFGSCLGFPSLREQQIVDLINQGSAGVHTFEAKFDGKDFYGCCVIRNKPTKITSIPKDNVLKYLKINYQNKKLVDNGSLSWCILVIDKRRPFTPGDHLLYFKAIFLNFDFYECPIEKDY